MPSEGPKRFAELSSALSWQSSFHTPFNSGGSDPIRLFTCLYVIMTQMQLHTECDDCISLLKHAATIISQSETEWETSFDKQYQTRLLANVASSECYMCALLHEHFPRLSESHGFGEELYIVVNKERYDPLAAYIGLFSYYDESKPEIKARYPESLRVHEGRMWRILGQIKNDC